MRRFSQGKPKIPVRDKAPIEIRDRALHETDQDRAKASFLRSLRRVLPADDTVFPSTGLRVNRLRPARNTKAQGPVECLDL